MMTLINLVAIDVETSRIYKGYSLNKEFTRLIYMNI